MAPVYKCCDHLTVETSAGNHGPLVAKLLLDLNDSFVLSGLLESAPLWEGTPGVCLLCWLCFLPRLGGPWKVHPSTHLECVGRRVHHVATYIAGGADHVVPTHKW
jgi:hypothetical protein